MSNPDGYDFTFTEGNRLWRKNIADNNGDGVIANGDGVSGFNFPADEALIQAEFEKNIPFALSVARSAQDPDDPGSSLPLEAPDLVADPFTVSHGTTQPVAVTAKRSVDDVELNYRIAVHQRGSPRLAAPRGGSYDPFTGDWCLLSGRADISYKRLTRTIEVPAGTTPASLDFKASFSTELDWDYLTVEAQTVDASGAGQNNWTTLPDRNGHTTTDTGDSCPGGWGERLHPQLLHHQTLIPDPAGDTCSPTGSTGSWNAATGSSNGWQVWSIDLSAYAGNRVQVSISYVTDDAIQGLGVFLDDLAVTVGATTDSTSFQTDLSGWAVAGPPATSGANANDWSRSQQAFEEGVAVTIADTVCTGFGAEGLTEESMRTDLLRRSMAHLLGG